MGYRTGVLPSASLLAALAFAPSADASLFQYRFAGQILLVEGAPAAPFESVIAGDAWVFKIWIDTTTPASAVPDFYGVATGTNYSAIVRAGLSVGAVDIPFGPLPAGFDGSIFVSDDTLGMDVIGMFAFVEGLTQVGVLSFDADMLALTDENIPTSISPEWDADQTAFVISYGESLTTATDRILGAVLEASATLVPSPGAVALFGLAGLLAAARRRH
jgi:hypothetical protein